MELLTGKEILYMQTQNTDHTTPLKQELPVASPVQQMLRIIRNTCYFSAVCGPLLLAAALALNLFSFFGVVHVSIRLTFFRNIGILTVICLILAAIALRLYGGQRFRTVADRPSKHRKSRLWGLILGFFVSLIALCFSIVIYDSDANNSIVKVTLIINGIALICNIYNTIIQSIYVRENPTGIAETPDAVTQFTSLWNALNLWGFLIVLEKFIF